MTVLRQHASLIALAAVFGLYAFWAAFRWSPYYPFNRAKKLDSFEDAMRGITPQETPFMHRLTATESRRQRPVNPTPYSRTLKDNTNG